MKIGSIQFSLARASLLPVILVSFMLGGVFLFITLHDNTESHRQVTRSLARQVAAVAEPALVSADGAALQAIAGNAAREPNVRSVVIVDAQAQVLASVGRPSASTAPSGAWQVSERVDPLTGVIVLSYPVTVNRPQFKEQMTDKASEPTAASQLLGHVLIEFSLEAQLHRRREILVLGFAITLLGLLMGGALALYLGRRVTRPMVDFSDTIVRIGQGELTARAADSPDEQWREVQQGLNEMAARLEAHRDELERRVGQATLALREKKEEAEAATLAKSRFLAAASHDLRQPTHALGMFAARLVQLPHSPEVRHLVENLESSVRAMQSLLDGLLDISRLDAGTVQVQVRAFSLAVLFEQLQAELALVAEENGLRFRLRPCTVGVLSDPALLHRILLNLLGNALRYTRRGGVLLACRRMADGQHVRIEVWDTGIGIAPEHHKAIFTEFFQINNKERDRSKGLGLGLSIVARAAELLGHRLQMQSRPGQGTRFSLELPLAPAGAVLERRSVPRDAVHDNLAGRLVLLVEDDALAREALLGLLRSWGCVVLEAEDLASALSHVKGGAAPDVIVSDYRLPRDENGIDVVARLRAEAGSAIPACLISGDTDVSLLQAAKQAGLNLLHKPVRPAKVRSLLRRLVLNAQPDRAERV